MAQSKYDWLDKEIAAIKTHKFHVVDGPADRKFRRAVMNPSASAPRSYKDFVVRFGNAELYRQDGFDLYWVTVFASLRETETNGGEALLWFGKNDMNGAFFKPALLSGEAESLVFEWIGASGYLRKTADGFEPWFERCCRRARKEYNKRRWSEILGGPEPFTKGEKRIVQARKRFRWNVVGVAKNKNLRFEVHNGSKTRLAYLSIGIGGAIDGGIWLPVEHIGPGETQIVEFDCYKKFAAPDEVEPYELPDPIPEDRELYWEFRALD